VESEAAFGERTICASGAAVDESAALATRRAFELALTRFERERPDVGILFVSPKLSLAEAMGEARTLLPETDFLGCSTAGEMTERGLTEGGVAVLLIRWGEASHLIKLTPRTDDALGKVAEQLQEPLLDKALGIGKRAACIVLGDGLSPMLEQVVTQLRRAPNHLIVGGGAADGRDFKHTHVAVNELSAEGGMACLQVMTKHAWGVGIAHGVHPVTPRMTVTKTNGNVVETIDGRLARDVYRDYATRLDLEFDPDDAAQFLVENELGVLLFEDLVRIRAGLRLLPNGALFCAGEVPEGSTVCIVRGGREDILAAATSAAEAARKGLDGVRAAGVMVFSCVCRGMVLGDQYAEEIEAVKRVFPDTPVAGFSSYGEVACTSERLDGYHNNTIVVAAIPE